MSETVLDVIRRIHPDFPAEALGEVGAWLVPRDWEAIKAAITADPCRNWRVVARRYRVSRATVYRCWDDAS